MAVSSCDAHLAPLAGLASAHVCFEEIALGDGIKTLQSVAHSDRSRGSLAFVAGPSAEAGNSPGGPGKTFGRIGIFLFAGAPLQSRLQRLDDLDLSFVEDMLGRLIVIGSGASEHELHGLGGADQCDDGKFFKGGSIFDDALLDIQSVALQGPKQLFDMPALAIPTDRRQGLFDGLDRMGGQQTPVNRLLAGRRVALNDFDGEEFDLIGSLGIGAGFGTTYSHPPVTHAQASLPRLALARPLRQIELEAVHFCKSRHDCKLSAAAGHRAVAAGPRQKVRTPVRQPGPFFVDVALTLIDNRDHGGLRQCRFGALRTFDPAIRFLLLDRLLAVVLALRLEASPHLHVEQAEAVPGLGVHGQHRMHEQADIAAIAYRAEAALAPALALVVDLAGVLNHQHMPPDRRLGYARSLAGRYLRGRDTVVQHEAQEFYLLSAIVPKLAQTNRLSIAYALQQPRAIFFSRSSPKKPMFISAIARSLESQRQRQNHTRFAQCKANTMKIHGKICAHASPQAGEGVVSIPEEVRGSEEVAREKFK